jgi:hypothetical protein
MCETLEIVIVAVLMAALLTIGYAMGRRDA